MDQPPSEFRRSMGHEAWMTGVVDLVDMVDLPSFRVSTCFNMFEPNQTFSDIDHDHLPDTDGSAKSPLVALRCLPMGRQGQSPEMLGLPHLHGPSVSSKI